jgi:feruloyl-CoA synthase
MPADTANLPPFRPLPYRGPDIEVRRGENGAVYLTSRSPMGAQPRSIPHALDDRAANALSPIERWRYGHR